MSAYLDLCDYVDNAGKIVELFPHLLKVRHPRDKGGGSIYSFKIDNYNEDLEHASKKVLDKVRGTL